MKKLRVGVIGCGVLGTRHAEIYSQHPDVELRVVCDHKLALSERLAQKFSCQATTDIQSFVEKLDAVSVCTPAVSHYEVSLPLIKAGVHLLVEKPITTRLEHADELIAEAKKRNLVLQTGHVERYNGAVRKVKEIVQKPIFIECVRIGFFDSRIADVGVVLDLMVHDIDIALYLVNSPVQNIQAVGMQILSQSEDYVNSRITFQNGTVCNFIASRMAQKRQRKIRIFEKDRYISLDYYRQEAMALMRDPFLDSDPIYQPLDIRKTQPLEEEIKDFVRAVRDHGQPQVRVEDAREALAVALKILEQVHKSQ